MNFSKLVLKRSNAKKQFETETRDFNPLVNLRMITT